MAIRSSLVYVTCSYFHCLVHTVLVPSIQALSCRYFMEDWKSNNWKVGSMTRAHVCVSCPGRGYIKDKVHPIIGNEGPQGEWRYSSTLSLTDRQMGVGGQRHAPAALPIVQEAEGV
jgi:hypothetical protein